MDKQNWIQRLLGSTHAPVQPANTPREPKPSPQAASSAPQDVSPEDAAKQPAPIAPAARLKLGTLPKTMVSRPSDLVPADWKVGDLILNKYKVTRILGAGGMGIVYKVHDRAENFDLAVKSPKPTIFSRAGGQENFLREAETWVNLGAHPHIVRCLYVLMLGGIPRVFAEYITGGSLADWIRQRHLYEGGHERALERILDVAIQFAWGLHAAHEQGLIHQDVKPANVMMTKEGIAKVTDFGLAKARALAGESEARGAGQNNLVSAGGMTPAYCSPEQAAHRLLSRKTDIWSWGVSVLEMFVGQVTWMTGAVAREALACHASQDAAIPQMPTEVVKLLNRCFLPRSEDRPSTMLEIATELQAIYARLLGCPYPRGVPRPAGRGADAPTLMLRGASLAELGRPEEGLVVLEQAIRLNPENADAHVGKGFVLEDLSRHEEALVAYEQAICLDPANANAHLSKGEVLRKLGRYEEALAACEQAIRLNPANAVAHFGKGGVLGELGRHEEALVAYEQEVQLDPADAVAHLNKGLALRKLGRREEALAAYEQAIRLDPALTLAHVNKGNVLVLLNRHEEALSACEQAVRLDPENALAHLVRGKVLAQLGRHEEALAAYEQAIRLNPHDAYAYIGKGIALRDLKRYEEALAAYEQAIRLDPHNAYTYTCKQELDDYRLRFEVVTTLGMADATKEEQDAVLYRIESIAQKRLRRAIPEMLTKKQLRWVDAMRAAGKNTDDIMQWIEEQLPQYDEMLRAIILGVAKEGAGIHDFDASVDSIIARFGESRKR